MKTLEEADVKPLDLILFQGIDPVSHAICFVEAKKKGQGGYSHAGLAVTREVLDLPFLEPGKTYVWESTMSAPAGFWSKFSDHVGDAEGRDEVRFGVQLRDLELVDIEDPRLVAPVDFLSHPDFEEPVPLVPEDPESLAKLG